MSFTIRVQLFAVARQLAGQESVSVQMPEGATVADLRRELAVQQPPLAGIVAHLNFAVDASYAGESSPITENAEVACIPPVSGG